MRKYFFYGLLILTFACTKKPEGFIITGEVTGFKDSTMLYLLNPDGNTNIDSSLIIDGKFNFKGKIEAPRRLYVNTKYVDRETHRFTSFFVENAEIKLKGDYDSFRYCTITGSPSQEIEEKLIAKIKDNDLKKDSLKDYYYSNRSNITEDEKNKIKQEIGVLDSINDNHYNNFIKENINSYSALEKLQWRKNDIPKETLIEYWNMLTPEFKTTTNGKSLNVYIHSRLVELDKPYIDFEAITIAGDSFKLSNLKTDYILLDFWAAGCGPCRMSNKNLAKQYSDLKDHLEIVSFSLDMKKEWFEKASNEDSITWTNVTDFKGFNSTTAIQYKINGIPCAYLIDKNRNVIKKYFGYYPEYIDEIKSILAEN